MRQKALALLSDFSYINRPVKITKRRRKQCGQIGVVRDMFWRKEEPWIVLQLPVGTRIAIPLTWTDIPPELVPVKSTSPVLDPLSEVLHVSWTV
jgi:hypothetical protein